MLKSTLQRLCIRLIQVSTSVMDKIGDDSNVLLDVPDASELERMQHLTTLVHSVQKINDQMQVIEKSFTSNSCDTTILGNI